MSKALDLSLFVKQTLDIILPDGDIIHIKKPTQANVIKLMALQGTTEENALEAMDELTSIIMNSNTDGRTFSNEWLNEHLDWTMKTAIIRAYSDFINELQTNPN